MELRKRLDIIVKQTRYSMRLLGTHLASLFGRMYELNGRKRIGMKTVVIGGAGFIGSNLCIFLLQRENNVVCIDNLSNGRKENLSELLTYKNFIFAVATSLKTFVLNTRLLCLTF